MKTVQCICAGILAVAWLGLTAVARAAEPSAFDLIKEGNRYVGEQSKDKVVQLRSEKSLASMTPNVWYVVFYDADATFKATEVKFGGGKKMTVTRPMRVLELGNGDSKVMDRAKLKTDSDEAIRIASAEPVLKPLTLKASKLILQHGDEGPVWKVTLWAAKLKNPVEDADVGSVFVSCETGKVLKTDLHVDSVD